MQENEKKKENASWDSVEKYLASEIIENTKREARGMLVGIICETILASVAIIGLLIANHTNTTYFLGYLSEYDFVSQDGEGYNYYNSGVGGNVSNGSENQKTEEPEQSERDGN